MNVKLLIVTHQDIGRAILDVAKTTLGELPIPVETISIPAQTEPEDVIGQLQRQLNTIPNQQEVLILTDIYGATPCNIANALTHKKSLSVVTGLNLPMLIRVLNYSDLPLAALVEKAISASKDSIRTCHQGENPSC